MAVGSADEGASGFPKGLEKLLPPLKKKNYTLVVELADTQASGACDSNIVRVQIPPGVLRVNTLWRSSQQPIKMKILIVCITRSAAKAAVSAIITVMLTHNASRISFLPVKDNWTADRKKQKLTKRTGSHSCGPVFVT